VTRQEEAKQVQAARLERLTIIKSELDRLYRRAKIARQATQFAFAAQAERSANVIYKALPIRDRECIDRMN